MSKERTAWSKQEAKSALTDIVAAITAAFNVPEPDITSDNSLAWEWRFETVDVWTKAGPVRMNVDIDRKFGHMYFQFEDVTAAAALVSGYGAPNRFNRHVGKWNSLEAAPDPLRLWVEELKSDFARVAEPNPDPEELAAWQAEQKAKNEYWARMREEFAAQCAARNACSPQSPPTIT